MLQPPPPFHLRPMRLADLAAVTAIEQGAFPTPTGADAYGYELTQNTLAHYQVLTTRQSDGRETLIGYTGYWLLADEVHVSTIAVDPAWRGRGLGELLLLNLLFLAYEHQAQSATAQSATAQSATLEVRRSNLVAQALYHKYHFAIVGERRRYYPDTGEDALLMTVAPLGNHYRRFLAEKRAALFARLASEA